MIILAVHTTTPTLGAAIVQDDLAVAKRELPPGREHLERLTPVIFDLLSALDLQPSEIDCFAAAVGPGSFSGVRIGLATMKGMALALGKPLYGVDSLEILAWQALQEGERGVAAIDAKRSQLYTASYRKEAGVLRLLEEPALRDRNDFVRGLQKISEEVILCAHPELGPELASSRVTIRPGLTPSAPACAFLALQRVRRGARSELHTVAPLYIRRSDAEENKRNRMESRSDGAA